MQVQTSLKYTLEKHEEKHTGNNPKFWEHNYTIDEPFHQPSQIFLHIQFHIWVLTLSFGGTLNLTYVIYAYLPSINY